MVGGRLILPLVTHRIRIDKDYVIRFNAIFNSAISDSIAFLSSTTSGRLDGVNFQMKIKMETILPNKADSRYHTIICECCLDSHNYCSYSYIDKMNFA
jgi:hypothetical protein